MTFSSVVPFLSTSRVVRRYSSFAFPSLTSTTRIICDCLNSSLGVNRGLISAQATPAQRHAAVTIREVRREIHRIRVPFWF